MKFIKRKLAYSESTPVQVDFHNTLESLDEVFRIISLSKLGKKTLSQFLPLLQSGEIWVEDLLREDAIRLQRENGVHGSVEAAFYYDGNQKRIYVNSRCKVGLLAPLFFHEMVHSLDEEYIRSYHDNQLLWQDFQEYAEKVMAEASMKSQKKVSEIRVEDCNQQDFLKLLDLKNSYF